jgi:hypothetical protein
MEIGNPRRHERDLLEDEIRWATQSESCIVNLLLARRLMHVGATKQDG